MHARLQIPGVAFVLLIAAVPAEEPQEKQPGQVKPIPPPGIKIPDADRTELQQGASQLGKEIEELRQALKGKPNLLELLPDVQIFHNAVRYPLEYDEFYDV